MPKKDKKTPVDRCPKCGKPTTSNQLTCQYCNYVLRPQVKKPKEDDKTKLRRLNMGAAKAQVVTAIVMTITMVAAIAAAFYAYNDFKIAYSEYIAKTRPELIIQNLKFSNTSDNTTDLLINITNFGDRPARNIQIVNLSLCAVSKAYCKDIHGIYDINQAEIIVYPTRVTTMRMTVDRKEYESIKITDTLVVGIKYRYSNQEYSYEADLKLHLDDNIWHIEQELTTP